MDPTKQALERHGIVLAHELGDRPARTARRRGLVAVQPGAYAAATQPLDMATQLSALGLTLSGEWAFLSEAALWLHGAGDLPSTVEVGVPFHRFLTLRAPARCRRVSEEVLRGIRIRDGQPIVRLEVAAVQACAHGADQNAIPLVESLLRERRTTGTRLRAACQHGLEGSERMRHALRETGAQATERRQRRLVRKLRDLGVRDLRTEVRLSSESGEVCYLDALHLPSRRALEVDGAATHGTSEQQLVDRRRDRWVLHEHGIETLRVAVREIDADVLRVAYELLPMLPPRAAA